MTTSTSTDWVSLAQTLYTGMPAPGPSGAVSFSATERPLKDNCTVRVTRLDMAAHVGTHIDAANHFIPSGRSIDQYPTEKFIGPGIALDVNRTGPTALDRAELDAVGDQVRPGDIVLLSFGYGRHFGTGAYREHPYITVGAAEWLVEREVKLVGFDLMTPDMPEPLRPDGFDWPVHQVLLGNDVLVMENLGGSLDGITGRRLEIFAAPMPIKGADGGPCVPIVRVVA
jgi:arylformamidase